MAQIDDYVIDVLMRDLVGHDRSPACFLVYLWLSTAEVRRGEAVEVSYQELAECIGVSKSSVQVAVSWLTKRQLLTAEKETVTSTPRYTVNRPWRDAVLRRERTGAVSK
jgi:DNA-binding transcriptional ArsR family regulator